MAQYRVETGQLDTRISNHYEVMMLANGPAGHLVSNTNPLPVSLGSDTINIVGNIAIPTTVNVASSPENPVHSHITEVGTGGILTVPYLPIGGNVNVTNIVSVTGNITTNGIVNIGNFPSIQTVNGSVFLSNSSIVVTGNVTANGTINVGNFPSTQTVNGTINIGNTVQVNVINFPATQNVVLVGASANVPPQVTTVPEAEQTTAFGELYGITITPVIQLDSIYGTTTDVIDTFTFGTQSSADGLTGLFQASSGNTSTGYAALTSKRFLRYRPGQGALARFTAAFEPTKAQTNQRAGLFNREAALQVGIHDDGVNGPRFAALRASGGKTHITVLTINTAPSGAQTATVTLNGVAYNISITAGTTTATAVQIAKVGVFTGWFVDQVDNTVVFSSLFTGPANGTFSFSATGTGTLATGTFSTKQVGVTQTENWTYQSDFNIDKLDGTGRSGMTLASEHLNVYQINFRWLGVGVIRYAIEDDATGKMILFHQEHYTNRYNVPHTTQPSFRLGYISQNVGSNTNTRVTGASMMAAVEGDIVQNELNRSTSVNKTGLSSGSVHHLLTLRNPYVTNGASGAQNGNYVFNAKEIILKDITIATQGNDPSVLYVFFNASTFSATHAYLSQPRDNGMVSTVDGTLDPTIDTAICRFATAINGQVSYPMRDFRVTIPPGASISFAIASTSSLSRATFAVVFSED